jgi:hypothetical protein
MPHHSSPSHSYYSILLQKTEHMAESTKDHNRRRPEEWKDQWSPMTLPSRLTLQLPNNSLKLTRRAGRWWHQATGVRDNQGACRFRRAKSSGR